jgi:hypothetical protein
LFSVFCVMFCRSLFVVNKFFFWPLHCLSFIDLRLLVTPLVSSICSYIDVFVGNLPDPYEYFTDSAPPSNLRITVASIVHWNFFRKSFWRRYYSNCYIDALIHSRMKLFLLVPNACRAVGNKQLIIICGYLKKLVRLDGDVNF